MEPHEKIRYSFYHLLRKLFAAVGHDFLRADGFKPNFNTYCIYLVAVIAFTSFHYTIMTYDIVTKLSAIAYLALVYQVCHTNTFTVVFHSFSILFHTFSLFSS